jgi:hypothetical protein
MDWEKVISSLRAQAVHNDGEMKRLFYKAPNPINAVHMSAAASAAVTLSAIADALEVGLSKKEQG